MTWSPAKYVASWLSWLTARPASVPIAGGTGGHGPAPTTARKSKPPAIGISLEALLRRGLTLHNRNRRMAARYVRKHLSLSRGASFDI
jgi:hypothetical protein